MGAGAPLPMNERKFDTADTAIKMDSRKFRVAVAAMSSNDEHVLTEIMLTETPNDDEGTDAGYMARIVAGILHVRTDLRQSFSKRP
jgi:hypothetical protein